MREYIKSFLQTHHVLCTTDEQANEFISFLQSKGFQWRDNCEPMSKNNWEHFKQDTVYSYKDNGLVYGYLADFVGEQDKTFTHFGLFKRLFINKQHKKEG